MQSRLPARPIAEEIPFNSRPTGRHLGDFKNNAESTALGAKIFFIFGFAISVFTLFGYTLNGIPDPQQEAFSFICFLLFLGGAIGLLLTSAFLFYRAYRIRGDVLEIYDDGVIIRAKHMNRSYVWWLNLASYQIINPHTEHTRLVLTMYDGLRYIVTSQFSNLETLVRLLPQLTHQVLVQRTVEELLAGRSVIFGALTLKADGLYFEEKYAAWREVLTVKYHTELRKFVIWTLSERGKAPQRFAVLDANTVPNWAVFTDFMNHLIAEKLRNERKSGLRTGLIDIFDRWMVRDYHNARRGAKQVAGDFAVSVMCLGIGLLHGAAEGFDTRDGLLIGMGILALIMGGLATFNILSALIMGALRGEAIIALYDTGFTYSHGTVTYDCPWSELKAYTYSFPSNLLTLFLSLWLDSSSVDLVLINGRTLRISRIPELHTLFRYVAERQVRKQIEAQLRAGEMIQFGPLFISF